MMQSIYADWDSLNNMYVCMCLCLYVCNHTILKMILRTNKTIETIKMKGNTLKQLFLTLGLNAIFLGTFRGSRNVFEKQAYKTVEVANWM